VTSVAAARTARLPRIADVPQGRLALWWVIASEVVIFGGLIACYVLYRVRHPEWGEAAAHTATQLGALNTLVLLTSSLTVVLAHVAATRRQTARVARYLAATIALGGVFLAVKAVEYTSELAHGFTFAAQLFWSFYYLLTGLHAAHVLAGMIAMAVVMRQAARGRNLQRVELVGLYWHFVDTVWIFLFPLLYLAK
jgi:heme/copper-type cytochrome/quinol oxidase subunit 3